MIYKIMVSVPVENKRYIAFIITYPQVVLVHLTMYTHRCILYENIFTSCGKGTEDIPRSPHCTLDTQP
jgi:hypothetical protein